jgi:hypothetical protein
MRCDCQFPLRSFLGSHPHQGLQNRSLPLWTNYPPWSDKQSAGVDRSPYAGHSFRIRTATTTQQLGSKLWSLRCSVTWSSAARPAVCSDPEELCSQWFLPGWRNDVEPNTAPTARQSLPRTPSNHQSSKVSPRSHSFYSAMHARTRAHLERMCALNSLWSMASPYFLMTGRDPGLSRRRGKTRGTQW